MYLCSQKFDRTINKTIIAYDNIFKNIPKTSKSSNQ